MSKKLSRIATFIESLPMDETLGECQSTILATNLNSMGTGTNYERCTNVEEKCQAASNHKKCNNAKTFCDDATNFIDCNNGYEPVIGGENKPDPAPYPPINIC